MTDSVKDRIMHIITHYNLSVKKFAEMLGMPQTTVNGYVTGIREPKMDFAIAIINHFENISAEWFMRGQGDMFKMTPSISSSNQGDGNKIEYSHIGIGNSVNANISDSSPQKTIYPTGKVDVAGPNHAESAVSNEDSEKQFLKAEIAHLRESMEIKDELIISLRETIELLRNKEK